MQGWGERETEAGRVAERGEGGGRKVGRVWGERGTQREAEILGQRERERGGRKVGRVWGERGTQREAEILGQRERERREEGR